jgi:hypothetical protein
MPTSLLTTRLAAVNMMLEAVWESPVSSLDIPNIASVAFAKRVLDETSVSVQTRGWWFNSETCFPLAKTIANEFMVPANTLKIDATDTSIDVVQRGNRLYDRKNHTFTFVDTASPLKVDLVQFLEFEDLPQSARLYIAVFAARKFKAKWQNEAEQGPTAEEVEALRNLEDDAAQAEDNNVLSGSWSVARVLCR